MDAKQKAAKEIAKLLKEANELMDKAVELSEKHTVAFTLPWGGEGSDQRGMGATYSPIGDPEAEWNRNDRYGDVNDDCYAGWQPSAGQC